MAEPRAKGRAAPAKEDTVSPTPADQWQQDDLIRLPSGPVARMKRPALMTLASRGMIPNPYLDPIRKLLAGRNGSGNTDEERWKIFDENYQAYLGVAQLALIEPRLVTDRDPGPGEIGPQHLSDQDLLWIYFNYTEGDDSVIATFRARPAPLV